jgi:hypothetical protein
MKYEVSVIELHKAYFDFAGAVALIGGSISWSLSDDFESSRRVFFVLRTAWDQTTFFMPSMRLTIGQTVQFPTNTNNELSVAGR